MQVKNGGITRAGLARDRPVERLAGECAVEIGIVLPRPYHNMLVVSEGLGASSGKVSRDPNRYIGAIAPHPRLSGLGREHADREPIKFSQGRLVPPARTASLIADLEPDPVSSHSRRPARDVMKSAAESKLQRRMNGGLPTTPMRRRVYGVVPPDGRRTSWSLRGGSAARTGLLQIALGLG